MNTGDDALEVLLGEESEDDLLLSDEPYVYLFVSFD